MVEPLPESNNPYQLLGVTYNDDKQTVKRAYARLIRQYKPEKHPAEFQRIRQAYESILSRLDSIAGWNVVSTSRTDGDENDIPDGSAAEQNAQTSEPTGKDGAPDLPFSLPAYNLYDRPTSADPSLDREKAALEALLKAGDLDGAAELFLKHVTRSELVDTLLRFAQTCWPEPLLRSLQSLSWNELRRNPNPSATELYRLILAQACLDGNSEKVIAELRNIHLQKDSIDHYQIENLIFRMKLALMLSRPKTAAEFDAPPTTDIDDDLIEEYFVRKKMGPKWLSLVLMGAMPNELRRYLLAAPLLLPDERIRHVAYMGRFAFDDYAKITRSDVRPILEGELEALMPWLDHRTPTIPAPTREQYEPLHKEMRNWIPERVWHLSIILSVVLSATLALFMEWDAIPFLFLSNIFLFPVFLYRDQAMYAILRKHLFKMILDSGADPADVADVIHSQQPQMKRLNRYKRRIRNDRILKMARVFNMARRFSEPSPSDAVSTVEPPYRLSPSNDPSRGSSYYESHLPSNEKTESSGGGLSGWQIFIILYLLLQIIRFVFKAHP